jgi:hypothetical protein
MLLREEHTSNRYFLTRSVMDSCYYRGMRDSQLYQSQKDDAQALKSSWTEGGVEPVYETSCVLHQAKTVRGGR